MGLEETQLLKFARARLAQLLPPSWTVAAVESASREVDGTVSVRSPADDLVMFAIEAKVSAHAGAEALIGHLLRRYAALRGIAPLLVMAYMGPAVRRACEEHGINYVDRTGWAWISVERPAIVIRAQGGPRYPGPPRPAAMSRLAGPGAGRVVRALLRRTEPIGVRSLAQEAGVAPGTVSKVLKALEPEGPVRRDGSGRVVAAVKRVLLERWIQDYRFLHANRIGRYLAPRGLPRVLARAADFDISIVGTGSVALRGHLPENMAPVTGLAQVALYVADPEQTGATLGLVPAEPATSNVILAVPYDAAILDSPRPSSGQLPVVDTPQAIADLLTSPGRGPEEAEQLIELLAESDPSWR